MAYIGKEPIVGNFQKCDAITVVNGQAAYTLQVSSTNVIPESVNHMLVSLNGILQAPTTSFTVSGATLTFASNLATGDVIDFVILLGNVLDLGTPSDGTVSTAKIVDSAVTYAKASGFGKVLQIVEGSTTTETGISSTSYATSTLTADITCSATSSKVLVIVAQNISAYINANAHRSYYNALFRDTTNINTRGHIVGAGTSANGYFYAALDGSIAHLDSPSSTSALTYSTKGYVSATADTCTIRFNTSSSKSTIQLIEIGA